MIKGMYLLHKRADMDWDDFLRYWQQTHAPIAVKMPGLRRYVQNYAVRDASRDAAVYDGVAEIWFDSAEALRAALASPEGRETVTDIANFLDADRSRLLLVQEVNII